MEAKGGPVMGLSESSHKEERKVSFIRGLKEEIKKISWTTKPELIFFTKVVVCATFAFGLGIYIVDLLIKGGLETTGYLAQLIFG